MKRRAPAAARAREKPDADMPDLLRLHGERFMGLFDDASKKKRKEQAGSVPARRERRVREEDDPDASEVGSEGSDRGDASSQPDAGEGSSDAGDGGESSMSETDEIFALLKRKRKRPRGPADDRGTAAEAARSGAGSGAGGRGGRWWSAKVSEIFDEVEAPPAAGSGSDSEVDLHLDAAVIEKLGASALAGREKKEYEKKQLSKLGAKLKGPPKAPLKMLFGMRKAAEKRELKKRELDLATGAKVGKTSRRKKREEIVKERRSDRGLGELSGRFKGGMLQLPRGFDKAIAGRKKEPRIDIGDRDSPRGASGKRGGKGGKRGGKGKRGKRGRR
eukprot:tig00021537_g22307.t1